jgi:hypothetical protein
MRFDNISRLPRWMHRIYAFLLAYFWLPCPLCGRNSGGHEWRDRDGKSSAINIVGFEQRGGIYHTVTRYTGICPSCTRDGLGDTHEVTCINVQHLP